MCKKKLWSKITKIKFVLKKLLVINTFLFLFLTVSPVHAGWNGNWYQPGETLDPECVPGDVDCGIDISAFKNNSPVEFSIDNNPWFVAKEDEDGNKYIVPASSQISLGSLAEPFKEIFVSADSVLVDGTRLSNANGLLKWGGHALTMTPTASNSAEIRLGELSSNGSNYVALKAPSVITSNLALTLPATAGSSGQALTTNGSGVLSWSSILSPTLSSGNIFVGNTSNVATGVAMNGDATISNAGALTIAANAVALGTDTTGNYVAGNTAGTGITISGTAGEGWLPTIAVNQGATLVWTGAHTFANSSGISLNPYGASAGNTTGIFFKELAANGTNVVGFKAPDSIAANKIWTLPSIDGSNGQTLSTNGSGVLSWSTPTPLGITSFNGLTATSQTFATSTTGTDFNIASSGDTHTFNIPDASASARGLVTKDAQTFGGNKTFANNLLVNGNVGIGTTNPSYHLELAGTNSIAARTIGVNGIPIAYLPDQSSFYGSLGIGNGLRSLSHSTGYQGQYNTATGINALLSATTGYNNTALGTSALYSNTTGYDNTALGAFSLSINTTGYDNVAVGQDTLASSSTSIENTAIGSEAGMNLTGSKNILLGYSAASNLTTGNNNIVIGYKVSTPAANSSNTLNIGNLIFGTGINGTGSTLSSGNVGIGTASPATKLDVAGSIRGNAGLTITAGAVSLPVGQIDNAELANSSLTVTSGTGLTGGGAVSLGGSTTVSAVTTGQGVSMQGNFGQWQAHSAYTDFNTNPAHWGWNYVQGNTNAPNSTSAQWYRNVVSLGSQYPMRGAGGYSLELAFPRANQAAAGVWMRAIENGAVGGWTQIGFTNPMTATGDLIFRNASGTTRLGIGTAGQVLTVSGGVPVWASAVACPTCLINNGNSFGAMATMGTNDNQALAFETNNTERVRITNGGNVGIGTVSPTDQLHIYKSDSNRITTQTGGVGYSGVRSINSNVNFFAGVAASHYYIYENSPVPGARLTILSGGNVGIGAVSPGEKLDIAGNTRLLKTNTATATTQYASGDLKLQSSSWDTALNDGDGGESVNNFSLRSTGLSGSGATYRFGILNNTGTELLSVRENGNVGIGTNNPGSILDVLSENGSLGPRIAHNHQTQAGDGQSLITYGAEINALRFHYTPANVDMARISTINYHTAPGTGWYTFADRVKAGLAFSINNAGTLSEAMRISNAGNVGIGTASPSQKLDIAGNLKVDGAIVAPEGTLRDDGGGWVRTYGATGWHSQTYGGGWYMSDTSWIRTYGSKGIYQNSGIMRTDGTLQVGDNGSTLSVGNGGNFAYRGSVLTANNQGRVGVGTASPEFNLTVQTAAGSDAISWRNPSYELGRLGFEGSNNNAGWIALYNSGTEKVRISADGDTYFSGGDGQTVVKVTSSEGSVRTDWPASWYGGIATWDIVGESTQMTANYTRSDFNRKKDISSLDDGMLEKIANIRPVSFLWKNERSNNAEGDKTLGFIAQEVVRVFPDIVSGEDGNMSINYNGFIPILTKSLQELDQRVDTLTATAPDMAKSVFSDIELTSKNYQSLEEKVARLDSQVVDLMADKTREAPGADQLAELIIEKIKNENALEIDKLLELKLDTLFSLEKNGALSFDNDIIFRGRLTYEDKDMAGYAKIKKGGKVVKVAYEKPYEFEPVVTATALEKEIMFILKERSKEGFTIEISDKAEESILFSWHAILVKEPFTAENESEESNDQENSSKPTDTMAPSSTPESTITSASESTSSAQQGFSITQSPIPEEYVPNGVDIE